MTSVIAVPAALDLLRQQVILGGSTEDIALPLRALQQRGLSKLDLTVKLERIRVENDLGSQSEDVEERCLLALELVHEESSRHSLSWSATTRAASLLARSLTHESIQAALPFALSPSDLLPPRGVEVTDELAATLTSATELVVAAFGLLPQPAELVRVPKGAFTSRPAAVLAFPDRLALEALAGKVESALSIRLPPEVIWPRGRTLVAMSALTDRVRGWESPYVVKADVEHFYESVEHSLLAVFLTVRFGVDVLTARASEAILTATMRLGRGLPQGPLASDVFASAYLFGVDEHFRVTGQPFVRYADDYYFPADSVGEGRAIVAELETLLRDIGLELSSDKTSVMGRSKFEKGVHRPAVHAFKESVALAHLEGLEQTEEESDAFELVQGLGLDEQAVWDLLYHGSVSVDDLLENVLGDKVEMIGRTYHVYLSAVANALRSETRTDELATLSRVAREALAVLTQSDEQVDVKDLDTVQLWFPELASAVVEYLISRPESSASWAASALSERLRDSSGIDWVDAWMAHAAGRLPDGAVPHEAIRRVVESTETGPLTRAEAARALLHFGDLSERLWRETLALLSPAMRSELIFAGLTEESQPTWLRDYAGEADHPGLAAIEAVRERSD